MCFLHSTLKHAGWERMRLGTTQLRKRFLRGEAIPGTQHSGLQAAVMLSHVFIVADCHERGCASMEPAHFSSPSKSAALRCSGVGLLDQIWMHLCSAEWMLRLSCICR